MLTKTAERKAGTELSRSLFWHGELALHRYSASICTYDRMKGLESTVASQVCAGRPLVVSRLTTVLNNKAISVATVILYFLPVVSTPSSMQRSEPGS